MNATIGSRVGLLVVVTVGIALLSAAAVSVWASPAGSGPRDGPSPPVTPPPVPTPTPVVLGDPSKLVANPTGRTGEVQLTWIPAQNATVHWVWSARWDNTDRKWTRADRNRTAVDGLEHWQDHWFTVIAGIERGNGQYEWSEWSNWARESPEWYPLPSTGSESGIGDVKNQTTHGPEGQLAFAATPCDGATAATVPTQHGGGSPTGSSCINGTGANFNLAPLVSSGRKITIQMACIDRATDDCALAAGVYAPYFDIGFVERVRRRTQGQVQFEVTSLSELGIPHSDSLRRLKNGELQSAVIRPSHVATAHPVVDIVNLWGLYPDQAAHLAVMDAVQPAMAELIAERGAMQVSYMVTDNHYLFSNREVHDDPEAWSGLRVRMQGVDLGILLSGMGVDPHVARYHNPYGALQSALVDGAIACASCGDRGRWYEVTDYIMGPFHNVPHGWLTVNLDVWNTMPRDLQNIVLEEGARHAYLNRHLVLLSTELEAVDHSIGNGVRYAPFSDRVQERMRKSAIENVVPRWVERIGGPDSEAARLFNRVVSPIVDVKINDDGSVSAVK